MLIYWRYTKNNNIKILLCIQGSKKTQGSKLGPADESRASLAHVLFLAHTQDHPSKDLSGQTNQWQKVCSIMGHVTIWILFFDLSWCSWRLKRARARWRNPMDTTGVKSCSRLRRLPWRHNGRHNGMLQWGDTTGEKERGNDAKWKMSLL